jgi:hypothetical protein
MFMKLIETIKKILKEEMQIPQYLRRRLRSWSEDEILNELKISLLRNLSHNTEQNDRFLKQVFLHTAYEMLPWSEDIPDTDYDKTTNILAKYLKDKYQKDVDKYLDNLYTGDIHSKDSKYVFYKHSERNGGRGFTQGFDSWYQLLERFGSWFPIDWWEIKKELDEKESGSILIMRPGDKLNDFGYYFTILKKTRE